MPTFNSPLLKTFHGICWMGVGIWTTTVFVLSSLSGPEISSFRLAQEINDKLLHFIAFFCGALPLAPAFRLSYNWPWKKVFWWTVCCISLYGALDEVHQYWTPKREGFSLGDWIADTLGALAGARFAIFIHAFSERKFGPPATGN